MLRYPTAEPIPFETLGTGTARTYTRAEAVRLDGEIRSFDEMAARALDVEPTILPPVDRCVDDECPICRKTGAPRAVTHPVGELFLGGANLRDLWQAAHRLTGGAILVPAELADRVAGRA